MVTFQRLNEQQVHYMIKKIAFQENLHLKNWHKMKKKLHKVNDKENRSTRTT